MTESVPTRPSRRSFLDWVLGTSASALVLSVLYPVGRYLIPPTTGESAQSGVTLPLDSASIAPNSGQIFRFGKRPGILLRTPSGELRAFSAVCTHLGCTVQYRPDLSHIWCACHNGHFDLNGTNVGGPPPTPLERYDVSTQGDQIAVRKRSQA